MTFYEAALRVLESEGRPLHVLEITEKSIAQNLLSHIGKTPEQTMLSRLAAMARRTRDRKVMVTAKDTFALVDWALPEDAQALGETGVPEPNPEESLLPLRAAERHPEPRQENARGVGRVERKRRDEDDGRTRRRRFPPIPDVVFEILTDSGQDLPPDEIVRRARERQLASDELSPEQILTALLGDNQRRIDAGRRPQFSLAKDTGHISLERAGSPSEAPPLELQAAFAAALGIPLEGGRPVLPKSSGASLEGADYRGPMLSAKHAVKEARRAVARALRKALADLDGGTFEKSVVRMMHAHGFRELKVAKRSKDGPLLTARRREGSAELRYAVRVLAGNPTVDRRAVQELRRDLGHYSAQVGLLVSAGELRQDARGEAQSSGPLVLVWCGDALGDKFLEAHTGVSVVPVELFEIDPRFFDQARVDAEEARRRREERLRERELHEPRPKPGADRDDSAGGEWAAAFTERPGQNEGESAPLSDEGEVEGEEEEVEAGAGTPAALEEASTGVARPLGRKRRRRRRGARGRPRPEGSPGTGAAPRQGQGAESASTPAPSNPAPPTPGNEGGGGQP